MRVSTREFPQYECLLISHIALALLRKERRPLRASLPARNHSPPCRIVVPMRKLQIRHSAKPSLAHLPYAFANPRSPACGASHVLFSALQLAAMGISQLARSVILQMRQFPHWIFPNGKFSHSVLQPGDFQFGDSSRSVQHESRAPALAK